LRARKMDAYSGDANSLRRWSWSVRPRIPAGIVPTISSQAEFRVRVAADLPVAQ